MPVWPLRSRHLFIQRWERRLLNNAGEKKTETDMNNLTSEMHSRSGCRLPPNLSLCRRLISPLGLRNPHSSGGCHILEYVNRRDKGIRTSSRSAYLASRVSYLTAAGKGRRGTNSVVQSALGGTLASFQTASQAKSVSKSLIPFTTASAISESA